MHITVDTRNWSSLFTIYKGMDYNNPYNYMYFQGYFQVKAMKSKVNLVLNHSVRVDNLDIT